MLMGDSVGGNMVLGVLSHILHPHPGIEPVKMSEPLRGAVVVSAMTDFDMSGERFQNTRRQGSLQEPADVDTIKKWAMEYLGAAEANEWNQPARADSKWWMGLETVVGDVLITGAKEEVMAGDIEATALKMKVGEPIRIRCPWSI